MIFKTHSKLSSKEYNSWKLYHIVEYTENPRKRENIIKEGTLMSSSDTEFSKYTHT